MTSVITGDIIHSTRYVDSNIWLTPLKSALTTVSTDTKNWEIYRGDSFQIEVRDFFSSFEKAIYIKACIKCVKGLDVRLAIGVGEKSFEGNNVTESNGEAFRFSGEIMESLKREKINLKIKTPNEILNQELNLFFKLALTIMDNWTVNSAEVVKLSLEKPNKLQKELAQIVGTNQEAVSKRLKRANLEEILELDTMYRKKISILLP